MDVIDDYDDIFLCDDEAEEYVDEWLEECKFWGYQSLFPGKI